MENEKQKLEQEIELLRHEMYRLADVSENLFDEQVVEISQKLDDRLVRYQHRMRSES